MGRPMALHLLDAGYRLGVYARRPEAAAAVDRLPGRSGYPTPAAVASQSDVVMTIVTATADVEEVLLGTTGVVHGARPGPSSST